MRADGRGSGGKGEGGRSRFSSSTGFAFSKMTENELSDPRGSENKICLSIQSAVLLKFIQTKFSRQSFKCVRMGGDLVERGRRTKSALVALDLPFLRRLNMRIKKIICLSI